MTKERCRERGGLTDAGSLTQEVPGRHGRGRRGAQRRRHGRARRAQGSGDAEVKRRPGTTVRFRRLIAGAWLRSTPLPTSTNLPFSIRTSSTTRFAPSNVWIYPFASTSAPGSRAAADRRQRHPARAPPGRRPHRAAQPLVRALLRDDRDQLRGRPDERRPVDHPRRGAAGVHQRRRLVHEPRGRCRLDRGRQLADLVALDRDYFTVSDADMRLTRPVLTLVGGKAVYEA